MIVPLFGVFILGAIAIGAFAFALPVALLVSYAVAIGVFAKRPVGTRILAQLGVFLAALVFPMIGAVVLLFSTMEGNAGSGVTILGGRDLFDPWVIAIPVVASVLIVVAGELGIVARRSKATSTQ